VWKKSDPSKRCKIPFRCRSWRHEGECRLWKGAQDFVRCREAIEQHENWSHICLTFEQFDRKLDDAVFRKTLRCWSKLRKRLTRQYGKLLYIQTWEIHRSGWPHCHIAASNQSIHANYYHHPKTTFNHLIRKHARASGFGGQGWCEPIRDQEAMAGYLAKLCRELTGTGKAYQIPINAPKNFRRLRASVRLLPPCLRDEDLTGILHLFPLPEQELSTLDNTGISGREEINFSIENRAEYQERLTPAGWVTEGLE